ncbi:MAG: MATE family efflux transporter [Eubacteriales bacterium]|nr:MATE family efflux transporter [Eubacteriales bacterium]
MGNFSSKKTNTLDMTEGSIASLLVMFALPLLLGNFFQMLYNTVDFLVVGNFVGKEALAAVGSTGPITNIQIFFFNGVATGAGVVISRYFGAKNDAELHTAISTAIVITFAVSAAFTFLGIVSVPFMLRMMSTPDDVIKEASVYLRIYFAGISGLLIYNMGSGILRAVGDTTRPLIFLIITSILNIILDLIFVIIFGWGIAGVAFATIISQFISAALVLLLLSYSTEVYRVNWKSLKFSATHMKEMLIVGIPMGIQSILTAFSNVFVQGYINFFGSDCMAAWGCFLKLEQAIFLPMQSLASASTTFVSQNIGAKRNDRVGEGTKQAISMIVVLSIILTAFMYIFSSQLIGLFSHDAGVIDFGVYFMKRVPFFMVTNAVNHVLAGSLRGRGDSAGPMVIMLLCFVLFRQLYLYIGTHISNTIAVVSLAYPVGWVSCCIIELGYFYFRWVKKARLN